MQKYRLSIRNRLALGFGLFLIIIIAFSGIFMLQINRLSTVFRDFYTHPYTVSNRVQKIETDIIRMHRAMKDLAISESREEVFRFTDLVDELEDEVLNDFTIVYDRYLGDRIEIDEAYNTFIEWREIRAEVIELTLAGQTAAAADVTRGGGADHVDKLENKIRVLRTFADNKAAAFSREAEETRKSVLKSLWLFCAIGLAVGIIIIISSVHSISTPLLKIVAWIMEISTGKITSEISINSRDEIGSLAQSCRIMQKNLSHKSNVAKLIASGDFSERVDVKDDYDEVAISINQIAENYSRITAENELQNWLKSGQNMLNEDIQGMQNVEEFSRKVISRMCIQLGAQIGAFYIADNIGSELKLSGSYAFNLRKNTGNVIPFGDGLGGQCAVEKDIISITDVPDGYFRIGSGTGDCAPANICAAPILYEGELVAVIELGSIREFQSRDLEFIRLTAEIIGTGLHTVLAREETEKLLVKTQRQSVALETRQEELRQSNEELEIKAKILKDSESQLKVQQEELRVTNEELEEKTGELERQGSRLKQKNEELDRAMKEIAEKADALKKSSSYKSEFMANMSHELRTPLNSIIILSRLLSQNEGENLTEKDIEFAQTIHSSGADLLHLINEILDLSKIEAGKMDIINEKVSIRQLISSLRRSFQPAADEKKLNFNLEVADGVPSQINSDLKRIEQILKNLLSNSFKFTENGTVSLSVSRESTGMLKFTVSDTGIGIQEEKQDLIFEAFQQADGTTHRQYGGTGLGLSISLELSRLLGGDLQMNSKEGRGSEFSLLLPETAAVSVIDTPTPGPEVFEPSKDEIISETDKIESIIDDRNLIERNSKSVLIIEDDPVFAKVVLDFARMKDFCGVIAPDGETGLHFADYYSPSAILLDVGLPGIDGWEVMERLKSSEATRYIPVHFLTAGDNSKEAFKKGAVGFLQKPVEPEMLDDTFADIDRILEGKMKKLLLVEDNDNERSSLKELLGGKDLEITEAATGADAMKMMLEGSYDCIVLDLGLKDISGFEILSQMRSSGFENVPVVVYTGKELTESERIELMRYSESVILKSARSHERLLEETALFLHRVESELPGDMQREIKMVREQNSSLKDKKILLVDDDMRNVFALSSVLERNGMEVTVGKNGIDAIEKLETEYPDLILMDIMMPEMDGYEAMTIIRKKPEFKNLPIIALTAKAMKGDRNRCIEAGANDYLSKPVEIEKLLSLLRVWLHD